LGGEAAEQLLVLGLPVDDFDSWALQSLCQLGRGEHVGDLDFDRRVVVVAQPKGFSHGFGVEESQPLVGGGRSQVEDSADAVGGGFAVGEDEFELVADSRGGSVGEGRTYEDLAVFESELAVDDPIAEPVDRVDVFGLTAGDAQRRALVARHVEAGHASDGDSRRDFALLEGFFSESGRDLLVVDGQQCDVGARAHSGVDEVVLEAADQRSHEDLDGDPDADPGDDQGRLAGRRPQETGGDDQGKHHTSSGLGTASGSRTISAGQPSCS